ncbi:MAG: peroxiredoxin [Thermoplasmata archaeon]|nr:peroxiredoxin [Thermoplasmata archaeon]
MSVGNSPSPARMAIILTENHVDKLLPFSTLVSGAVAMGFEVHVFASFWGLDAFRKSSPSPHPPTSPGHGAAGAELESTLADRKVPSWKSMLSTAKGIGTLRIYACSQSMQLFHLTPADLDPIVDEVVGIATFIDRTRHAEASYFVG